MEPTTREVGKNTALVFPSLLSLVSFVQERLWPKLGCKVNYVPSRVSTPKSGESGEYLLLFDRDDFKEVIEPILKKAHKGKSFARV